MCKVKSFTSISHVFDYVNSFFENILKNLRKDTFKRKNSKKRLDKFDFSEYYINNALTGTCDDSDFQRAAGWCEAVVAPFAISPLSLLSKAACE